MEVKDDDLGLMLACTVRYAMGRRSYIVGTAADFVRTYQAALRKDQIAQLGREVREKLAWYESDGHPMGDDVDHRRWQHFAEWCDEARKGVARPARPLEVPDLDMWLLLLCTVRYSMGRRTGINLTAFALVKSYKEALMARQIAQIGDEVRTELATGAATGTVPDPQGDAVPWRQFAEWCDEEVARRRAGDQDLLELTHRDQVALANALVQPPAPSARLRSAAVSARRALSASAENGPGSESPVRRRGARRRAPRP